MSLLLQFYNNWYNNSSSNSTSLQSVKPYKTVFLDIISQLSIVESVCISVGTAIDHPMLGVTVPDLFLADGDFAMDWLPRVSKSLKSLSISDHYCHWGEHSSSVLSLISTYCQDLVNLNVSAPWLSMVNLNPMPMLTSLTLSNTTLDDKRLTMLNTGFRNLQVLDLIGVLGGPKDLQIHLHNLKTCYLGVSIYQQTLTLITPNLITLEKPTICIS